MTQGEAIYLLRLYRRTIPKPERIFRKGFGRGIDIEGRNAVYERYLVLQIIEKISNSDKDPIDTVRDFYYFWDDVLCNSPDGHTVTHTFASIMETMTGDILHYLIAKEKNEHGQRNREDVCNIQTNNGKEPAKDIDRLRYRRHAGRRHNGRNANA